MKQLKATDLMVGDWVTSKKWRDHPFRLTRIKDNGRFYHGVTAKGVLVAPFLIEELEPIPLTPEILKKNGFELRDGFLYHRIDDKPHHYDFKLENGGVFTSEGYTLQCCIYHLTIRYVHELQNALRLCGLDELADNFKLEELI